jgi:hypothetical protein
MKHVGRYYEAQIGPAPTQMHTFPLPASSTFEWTEWFKGFDGDVERLQSVNYSEAIAEVGDWQASSDGMAQETIDEMDAFFESIADTPPDVDVDADMLYQGMPWGGLREALTGEALAPGCPFPVPEYDEATRPWLDLLANGTFSEETLRLTPVNFEVDDDWVNLLLKSAARGANGSTWLHHLFLGTHALETGNRDGAYAYFEASVALQPTAHAERSLALLAANVSDGMAHYDAAWRLWGGLDAAADPAAERLGKDLAVEYAGWLMLNGQWERLRSFLAGLPRAYAAKDVPQHAAAALALHDGDYEGALAILTTGCFPTYGSVRQVRTYVRRLSLRRLIIHFRSQIKIEREREIARIR